MYSTSVELGRSMVNPRKVDNANLISAFGRVINYFAWFLSSNDNAVIDLPKIQMRGDIRLLIEPRTLNDWDSDHIRAHSELVRMIFVE